LLISKSHHLVSEPAILAPWVMASDFQTVADALARISLDLANLTMRQDQMEESRDKAMSELREVLMTSQKRNDKDKYVANTEVGDDYSPIMDPFGFMSNTQEHWGMGF
ncbi:hypothetical protein HAX54_004876, partial [Datura stramonium]|nr:hypothetical protein [Datura stramonium]